MLLSGKHILKNIRGGREEKIKKLFSILVKHRKAFLDQANISTEITAFQILDDGTNINLASISFKPSFSIQTLVGNLLMASGLPIR